ncbi:MAG: hypothetical protein HC812_17650 [Leptolyngbya sp. RL_3_1]|nr:hypothetical protein [Leptolyngbya sp. RL_3_1]
MNSNHLNRTLLRTVGAGWVAFAIAALAIRTVFAAPDVTLLVDRSYCEPSQWQAVAEQYADLYQQHQRGSITISATIFFSDLGEETSDQVLTPEAFQDLTTYGRPSPDRQAALEASHPQAQRLSCAP